MFHQRETCGVGIAAALAATQPLGACELALALALLR